MITKANFKLLLELLGFKASNELFSNQIGEDLLKADFGNEKLIYPKGVTIGGDFTTNFSSNENFVVFECVHRLLELGYKPSQLTLEPKWKLGHGASGGRADIVIRNNEGKVFAIIECKTAGKEFDDAWSAGLQYPSQLFSYAQQEGSTEVICLYTSNFEDNRLERFYYAIPLVDNENLLNTFKDEGIETSSYKNANRFDELFNVWKNTYQQEAFTQGLFEDGILPFQLGKKNYSLNDLKEISHSDIQKKYHQFATILRKYNVSGRENAFDKLVNLFLCKVVDEKENPTNLKFYWRGMAYDTHFDLQDRLQLLYQQGMKQFLGEDVTYINQEKIDEAFRFLQNDPDATKETINRYFKQLKFFTNNDFAFIDVHNEKLFYQNAEILLRIVEMLQNIRLKSEKDEHSNQFLGDMFEGFLDAGIKQSEGQFFTPMPVVKFIMNSLPLEQLIAESDQPPKAVDYACGAGHFLTELARQLKPLVGKYKKADIKEYYRQITGIEKEYRLSKVAKVSAFMYGQDEIQIIYADSLARNPNIQDSSYNILVANPPYSVKGFLETLSMPDKKNFELFGSIDSKSVITNNAIETFFIERAKQLLAPDGIAAIILPSSVLSNDSRQYQQTREILLKYFHIIAIAEMGSGTFGKTGTNTVILFLRRRKTEPVEAEHFKYRIDRWLYDKELTSRHKKNKIYNDLHLLETYCKHIGIAPDDYKDLWGNEKPNEAIKQSEIWQEYSKAFYASTAVKNLQKKPVFKKLKEEDKKKELDGLLLRDVRRIEAEKLLYFLLANSNEVPVLIIKSPADNKAMKKFLGYEWSSAKGNEGIKYLNTAVATTSDNEDEPVLTTAQLNSIQTPLYNPAQKEDANKLNYYIQQNFERKIFTIPESLNEYAHIAKLTDILDFSRKDFNKAISLTAKKVANITSKWEMKKLREFASLKGGDTFKEQYQGNINTSDIPFLKVSDMNSEQNNLFINVANNYVSESVLKHELRATIHPAKSIIFPKVGKAVDTNKKRMLITPSAVDNNIMVMTILNNDIVNSNYLFEYFLWFVDLKELASNSNPPSISAENSYEYKIPVPPLNVQQQIVDECIVIDNAVREAEKTISEAKAGIEKKISDSLQRAIQVKFDSVATLEYGKPLKEEVRIAGDIPVMGSNGIVGYHDKSLIKGPSIIVGRKGSAGAVVYIEEDSFPIDTTFYVKYDATKVNLKFFYYLLQASNLPEIARGKGIGVPGLNRNNVHNLKIPLPSITEQQKIVKEIELLETQIAQAKIIIENAPAQKQAVLKKWLE